MPTPEQHLGQAEHNEAFAAALERGDGAYLDWAVTGMFYAALHYVCAYLAARGNTDYQSHFRIMEYLRSEPALRRDRRLRDSYRDLRNDSEEARYRFKRFSPTEVQELRDAQLRAVREAVRALLQR